MKSFFSIMSTLSISAIWKIFRTDIITQQTYNGNKQRTIIHFMIRIGLHYKMYKSCTGFMDLLEILYIDHRNIEMPILWHDIILILWRIWIFVSWLCCCSVIYNRHLLRSRAWTIGLQELYDQNKIDIWIYFGDQ